MKFLQYLTATILVASLLTSCQPTLEEQLEGTWVIHETTVTGESQVPGSNSTLLFNGVNNASTLEIKILDDQTATLTGLLSVKTTATRDGEEIMTFDVDHDYNESRTWQILENEMFELVGSEDFGHGRIVDDKLVFELNEMTHDTPEYDFFGEGDNLLETKLVFIKQ